MATAKSRPRGELQLVVRDTDLDKKSVDSIKAAQAGDRVLGPEDAGIADVVPKAVLRRVAKLIPSEEFTISEIALKFTLGGELLGFKVSGDVSVKVVPRK
jgi:hypothetical protein